MELIRENDENVGGDVENDDNNNKNYNNINNTNTTTKSTHNKRTHLRNPWLLIQVEVINDARSEKGSELVQDLRDDNHNGGWMVR